MEEVDGSCKEAAAAGAAAALGRKDFLHLMMVEVLADLDGSKVVPS
jgi:hypothetical protein